MQAFSGSELIQAGTIVANLLAAGIIVAGIVNGTLIEGAQFVAFGSTGDIFVYSGTPTTGNLIASIAGVQGVDNWPGGPGTNTVLAGIVAYTGNIAIQLFSRQISLYTDITLQSLGPTPPNMNPSAINADPTYTGQVKYWSGMAATSGDSQTNIQQYSALNANPARAYFASAQSEIDFNANQVVFNTSGGTTPGVSIPAAGGPFVPGEFFHNISLGSGLTGFWRVRLTPWNTVIMDIEVVWSGTTGTTITMGSLPSASYYPTSTRHFPIGWTGTPTAVSGMPRVFLSTSGGPQLITVSATAANTSFGTTIEYPNV